MTQELYSLRILGIPSLMFPLIITGADLPRGLLGHEHSHPSSTPGEACAPCWGMRTGSPAPASMASFAPVASLQCWIPNWSVFLAILLVRPVQLGTAWHHWSGVGSPPGQISCLVLTKGCRAGWIRKIRVANFI